MEKIDTKNSSIYSDNNNVIFRSNNDRMIIAVSEYHNGKNREFGIEVYDELMEKYVKYEMSYIQMIDMISEIQDRISLGNREYNGEVMHPRSVVALYGTIKTEELIKIDPSYERIEMKKKHRYLYILHKKYRKKITGELKHKIIPYPKDNLNSGWEKKRKEKDLQAGTLFGDEM